MEMSVAMWPQEKRILLPLEWYCRQLVLLVLEQSSLVTTLGTLSGLDHLKHLSVFSYYGELSIYYNLINLALTGHF